MIIPATVASTSVSKEEFVVEQLSFSTADVERIEFYGETREFYWEPSKLEKQLQKFRLVDGELFSVDEEGLPPNAQPLTEDAGVFRIVDLRRQ